MRTFTPKLLPSCVLVPIAVASIVSIAFWPKLRVLTMSSATSRRISMDGIGLNLMRIGFLPVWMTAHRSAQIVKGGKGAEALPEVTVLRPKTAVKESVGEKKIGYGGEEKSAEPTRTIVTGRGGRPSFGSAPVGGMASVQAPY